MNDDSVVSRANFIPVDHYGCPNQCPQKQQVKLLGLACSFVNRKFNETQKYFSINYPYNSKLVQVFKSGPRKICRRKPWKSLKGCGLLKQAISWVCWLINLCSQPFTSVCFHWHKFLRHLTSRLWCGLWQKHMWTNHSS